ncbi:hypothetical protein P3T76_003212 [Phytophthora citrophthora]|uniref:Uncharacterized protein n=1 Tax=Phytophthora citrophthora TaxID=4793 RepID=A0AAD9LTH2_9STRA|nr:hypothetical protein P3T76_003212 [Phytophthora citrophthora]
MGSPAASHVGSSSASERQTASPTRDPGRSPSEDGEIEVDYEESVAGDAHDSPARESTPPPRTLELGSPRDSRRNTSPRQLRQPNPFPSGPSSFVPDVLRNAPPLPTRESPRESVEDTVSNPLDEAQEASISGTSRSHRPVLRDIVGSSSRRDYGFEPRDPAEQVKQLLAQPTLHGHAIGAAPRTAAEIQQRKELHERYLFPQACTAAEYRQRLDKQRCGESVPQMRTYSLVLHAGETPEGYMIHVGSWAEASRKLQSFDRLMESCSEVDVRLARGLLFQYAKVRVRPGRFPRHTTAVALAPRATIPAPQGAPSTSGGGSLAEPAADQSLISAASPSTPRPSGEELTSSPPGASDFRDQKRPRRQGSLAAVAPQTPTSSGNVDTHATSPYTGFEYDGDAAPSGVPHGSGGSPARRATAEVADSQRRAILDECDDRYLAQRAWYELDRPIQTLQSQRQSLQEDMDRVWHSHARLAHDLEEVENRVAWLEGPAPAGTSASRSCGVR